MEASEAIKNIQEEAYAFVKMAAAVPVLISTVNAMRDQMGAMQASINILLRKSDESPAPRPNVPKKFYTVSEAATALGLSEESIRRIIKERKGLLSRSKATRRVMIPSEDIENFGKKTV